MAVYIFRLATSRSSPEKAGTSAPSCRLAGRTKSGRRYNPRSFTASMMLRQLLSRRLCFRSFSAEITLDQLIVSSDALEQPTFWVR